MDKRSEDQSNLIQFPAIQPDLSVTVKVEVLLEALHMFDAIERREMTASEASTVLNKLVLGGV